MKVAPRPGSDSTQIRPPWRSTILLQIAKPMPVPGYCVRVCRRSKIRKMRSRDSGAMPMPLSRTEKTIDLRSDRRPRVSSVAGCLAAKLQCIAKKVLEQLDELSGVGPSENGAGTRDWT